MRKPQANGSIDRSNSNSSSILNSQNVRRHSNTKTQPSTKTSKKIEEKFECKYCKLVVSYRDVFRHLEYTCEYFSKEIKTKKFDPKAKFQISKLNLNAKLTPETDTPDPEFEALPFREQTDLLLASSSKDYRPTKKLILVKEIDIQDLSIGQIHLKSNQFCVFGLFIKNKYIKYHIAYRVEQNNIQVIDILTAEPCAMLKGHEDLVTEIRYFKTKKEYNLLLTSSYDGNLFIWEVSTFNRVKEINTKSWVLSAVIAPHIDQEYIFIAGGYSKNSPIKAYELESGQFKFEMSLREEATPVIVEKYQQGKVHFLFVGTDNENPGFYIFDYAQKVLLKSFQTKQCVTSIVLYSSTNSQLFIYTSDYLGTIKEYDVLKLKLNTEFSVGQTALDLIMWDDYYLISCGDRSNSVKTIVRHKHRVAKSYSDIHEKVILNIQRLYVQGLGNCLFTLSSDKKIKLLRL